MTGRGSSARRVRACSAPRSAPGGARRPRPAAAGHRPAADTERTSVRPCAAPARRSSYLRRSATRPSFQSAAGQRHRSARPPDRGTPTRRWRACTSTARPVSSSGREGAVRFSARAGPAAPGEQDQAACGEQCDQQPARRCPLDDGGDPPGHGSQVMCPLEHAGNGGTHHVCRARADRHALSAAHGTSIGVGSQGHVRGRVRASGGVTGPCRAAPWLERWRRQRANVPGASTSGGGRSLGICVVSDSLLGRAGYRSGPQCDG